MKPACILGCQYIPSVAYFAHWQYHGVIAIEAKENYQKRTWRNRSAIIGHDGPLTLTVPLAKGKHQQTPITDVVIAYHEPWPALHINSLQARYGKTAFGEEVLEGFQTIVKTQPKTLWELNTTLLNYITQMLKGKWNWLPTDAFVSVYPPDIVDLRKGIVAGQDNTNLGIPTYPQTHRIGQPFLPNLSILDLLCHLGPAAAQYLKEYSTKIYPQDG